MKLLIPARINLLGGWSDQLDWDGPAAVVNMAVGWRGGGTPADGGGAAYWPHDPHPFAMDASGFHSKVEGIGTGLGASSIRFAAQELWIQAENAGGPTSLEHACRHSVAAEAFSTRGGWQDAYGALFPGFKLIVQGGRGEITIHRQDDHPVIPHLLLFDTGQRRESKEIGDRVRYLFGHPAFRADLTRNAQDALSSFEADALTFIRRAIAGWKRLVKWVPMMDWPLPEDPDLHGGMLVGAGGGGWGVLFMKNPEKRDETMKRLRGKGVSVHVPEPCALEVERSRVAVEPGEAKDVRRPPRRKDIPGPNERLSSVETK